MLRAVVLSLGLGVGVLAPGGPPVATGADQQQPTTVEHDVDWFRYVDSADEAPARQRTRRVAHCPAGTQATGGGVRTTGESAADAVVVSAPYDSRDRDRRPDDGWVGVVVTGASDQLMVTSAVCAPFEVSYVIGTRRVPARSVRRFDLPCPEQLFPVGGGARSTGDSRRIMLGQSGESPATFGWRVGLVNGSRHRETLTGYAACMRLPGDRSYAGFSQGPAHPGVTTERSAVDVCDLNGQHVSGGGPVVIGTRAGHVTGTNPSDGPDEDLAPDDGWTSRVYNETSADITQRTTFVCLP